MPARIIESLNRDWKFIKQDIPGAWYRGYEDGDWEDVDLPHDWSVQGPFSRSYSSGTGYVAGGTGWYRKSFYLPEKLKGSLVKVCFNGIYKNSRIWCNSSYLGKRPSGYNSFSYDITPFCMFGKEVNIISVRVSHEDLADSRWFTGSGIYRDVNLIVCGKLCFEEYGVFVAAKNASDKTAELEIETKIHNYNNEAGTGRLKLTLRYDKTEALAESEEEISLGAGEVKIFRHKLKIKNPKFWSPDSPDLYTLFASINSGGNICDSLTAHAGIRTYFFDPDKGFSLNGKSMKLKGVCLHHDAGCLGAAVPAQVWRRRLENLKDMGCNAIRLSHNPHDPNLLDLCDSIGFLVVAEAFDEWEGCKNKWSQGHNIYPPAHFGYSEDFPVWHEKDLSEFVLRDRNHPSIILWSIGNEIDYPNDPYCHPLFISMTGNNDANKPAAERMYDPHKPNAERLAEVSERLVKIVKKIDVTRPVTAAIAFPELSNQIGYTDTLDVIGYNYKEHLYMEDHVRYPKRALFGSENGPGLDKWQVVIDNDYIAGQFVWTGIDYLGEAEGWPARISPSGFLDLAGFPKPSYYYRKSLWSDKPFVYLTVRDNASAAKQSPRHFGDYPHWNWTEGQDVEIFCYSNCRQVELFLNGASLGIRRKEESPDGILKWRTKFKSGELRAEGYSSSGKKVECELKTAGEAVRIAAVPDSGNISPGGREIVHVMLYLADSNGISVPYAADYIYVEITGPAQLLGLENGNPRDLEPYNSNRRKLYEGKALAYIRSTGKAGPVTLKFRADGYPDTLLFLG